MDFVLAGLMASPKETITARGSVSSRSSTGNRSTVTGIKQYELLPVLDLSLDSCDDMIARERERERERFASPGSFLRYTASQFLVLIISEEYIDKVLYIIIQRQTSFAYQLGLLL